METSPQMMQAMADTEPPQIDWEDEHARLHAQVDALEQKIYLTTEEQVRLKTIKKQRLRAKDRLRLLGRL